MDIITLALAKKQIGKDTTKAVSDYLDEHLTNPTNPPLDTSLSIAGAAADSKAAGDKLSELKEELNPIKKEVPANINVLNPSNFTLKGYLNSNDGVTFTANNNYMCMNDFIDIPFGTEYIYAKFPQTENNDRICCFLFYDQNNNFVSSASGRLNGYDFKAAHFTAPYYDQKFKFKFWVNKTSVSGGSNDVCLSFSEPSEFVQYESTYDVNNAALNTPDIYLPFAGKKIVNFGDSIFGNKQAPFSVSYALAALTGATVYNIGFGGTCASASNNISWDAFEMYQLAKAVADDDYTAQDTALEDTSARFISYFPKTLALLKSIDFSKVDIITIAYGTNDFTANVVLDNENNPVDTSTFCGALRYSLQQIMGAYPHIKIFVCGQTWRCWLNSSNVYVDDSNTHENNNGDKLTDFVTATKRVCDEYQVTFIDNYYSLGINRYNYIYYFHTNDGTHHNYLGAKLIAEHIKHCLF